MKKSFVIFFVLLFFAHNCLAMKRVFSLGTIKKSKKKNEYKHLFNSDAISRISYAFRGQVKQKTFEKMNIDEKLEKIGELLQEDGTVSKEQCSTVKARRFVKQLDFNPKAAHDLDLLLSTDECAPLVAIG